MEYGLIGEKLGHSYSKLIQEKLIENYVFEIHPIERKDLDAFMKAKEFKGINVTIPYKQDVIPYLDSMDDASKKIGAVNTIVNHNGSLVGHNTDYYGFKYMLEHHNIIIENKKVLVMGNGGASKAIQAVLHDLKAKELLIVDIILSDSIISLDEVYKQHLDVEVIVNTTPVGMYPNVENSCIDTLRFPQLKACVDVVYNPFSTEFTLQAKKRGITSVTGLEMLVAQAKYALEFFKNITINDNEIDRIYKEILLETCNINLIGMPNSGKSTIGKIVAEKLGKEWIDIDSLIEDKVKMSVSSYYQSKGEMAFRTIENEVVKNIRTKTNALIICGGGTVLENNNVHNLQRNGFFIQIERDLDKLDTPLYLKEIDMNTLLKQRKPIYDCISDATIKNNDTIEACVQSCIHSYHTIINNL